MPKPFLGVGVGFPFSLNDTGAIQQARYEESVRQSIWLILATAKGERAMRPDFGCGIYDLVFEVVTPGTIGKVVQAVQTAMLRLEPRIDVLEVQVQQASSEEGDQLLISVDYQVRATNNVFNLVYPFYLERSAG